jgi:hypothetical protein
MQLLQALKQHVQRDQEWHEMGVELYFSKDTCSCATQTDKANPSCSISFNPVEVKMETVPSCERIAAQEERKKPRENQAGQKADITWTPDVKR